MGNRKYDVYQVDSFTSQPFTGNPAGVVLSADGLTEREMLSIARELNNSETAFIFSSNDPDHYDIHVRFFTPTVEVPICGHATIAAHYVRAIAQKFAHCIIIQKTGAGLQPIEITPQKNDYIITMTQGPISFSEILSPSIQHKIICALGLTDSELDKRCPIQIVSTGHSKIMIGIKQNQTLHRLQPNLSQLKDLSLQLGCNGYFVFTLETTDDESLTHGRMFAPAIGINEDPVTGNAHGPLGAYLVRHKLIQAIGNEVEFTGTQGEALGRPGKVRVIVSVKNGLPEQVKISGHAVIIFKTTIVLD
jgi:PhzF family phenazine biosynthesis protein